jgi:hypothetical protein
MLRRRPGGAVFFGIANIAVGALGLMAYGCCGFMVLALSVDRTGTVWSHLAGDVRLFAPLEVAHLVLCMLLCVLLLISGIGMLSMHNWARLLSIACGVVALLLNVWNLIFQIAFVSPAMQRYVESTDHPIARADGMAQAAVMNFCTIGIAAVAILYSVALLITLLLPDVAGAFRHEPAPAWADDFDDDDRPRRHRRRDDDWDD